MKRRRLDGREFRAATRSIWDYYGFDVFDVRWMFEGRNDQVHPEDDWDHPAWSTEKGVLSA